MPFRRVAGIEIGLARALRRLAAGTAAACRRRASDGGRPRGPARSSSATASRTRVGICSERRKYSCAACSRSCPRARPGPGSGSCRGPGRWSWRDGRGRAARRRSAVPAAMAAATRAVSKRAQARTLPGVREVDHQHAHRPVGLGLQDEAAFELQRGAEQHGEHDRLAEQLGHRRRIVVTRKNCRRPPARAAPRGRAGRALPPRTAGSVSSAEVAAGARDGMAMSGIGHAGHLCRCSA